jgi:muramoyltetrapeptide carboxypeptidase LdcA involved in peptidoglycan recycling
VSDTDQTRQGRNLWVRYPAPLEPGDLIAVTSPSSGVPDSMRARLDFCVEHLRQRGYRVVVGSCMDGSGVVSAPASERAAELSAMLTDPQVAAVVPPWGGECAIELLPLLDFEALADARPTWLVGYSDTSTLMLPLTLRTGIATVHSANLMDTPYRVPGPLMNWLDVVAAPVGSTLAQGSAPLYQGGEWPSFTDNPTVGEWELTTPGVWKQLAPGDVGAVVQASGRLVGGCLETVAMLPGSPFGDVDGFARSYAPEGLIVYLEVAESSALTAARLLHHVRLAGWFDDANAVLIGRTRAPESSRYSQLDALRSALGDLDVPVLYDVDLGHVPPQLALVNGALATLEFDGTNGRLAQQLI